MQVRGGFSLLDLFLGVLRLGGLVRHEQQNATLRTENTARAELPYSLTRINGHID